MKTHMLSVKRIAKLTEPGRYLDGQGLLLQITPTGVKSWIFRYAGRDGREHFAGLGALHTVTLEEARERARKARLQLLDGIDPLEARKAAKAARALEAAKTVTFEEAATKYYEAHEAKWSKKHRQAYTGGMRDHVLPKIGKLAVDAIDTGQVLRCIEPIWQTKGVTANRIRGRIEAVLNWATVRGYRTGDNPARWTGYLDQTLPAPAEIKKVENHPALPYAELPAFMAELASREGIAARALAFAILTAARTGEVIGATWDEIDLQAKLWTIPAARMKADKEHRIPLSDAVLEILAALPRDSNWVFVGVAPGAAISSIAMYRVLRRVRDDVNVHGFRSTFSTWAHEQTGHSNHVIEMSLAHAIGNAVEKAYQRGDLFDKRRKLMNDWARFATTPAATGDNIVAMKAR
jgi:integrase